MAFGIAEAIATISATMQAVDFYEKYGGTKQEFIQTLDINYRPERFEQVERQIVASFGDMYVQIFAAVGETVKNCGERFKEHYRDPGRELEREHLGKALRGCVCRNIKILKDALGEQIPDYLKDDWRNFRCDDYGKDRGMESSSAPQHKLKAELV